MSQVILSTCRLVDDALGRVLGIDNKFNEVTASLEHMTEYLNYMPINGGDFDGNDNTHVSIDGGTY